MLRSFSMQSRRTVIRLLVILALVFSVLPAPAASADSNFIHVTSTGATSGPCGVDWTTPCGLQYALTTVAVTGDEIWVAAGTYYPTAGTDRSATFTLRSGITLYGGFAGIGTAPSQRNWTWNVTTLSGEIGEAGNADNSYHVVTTGSGANNTAVLDGFTVTAGNSYGDTAAGGGGMVNNGGSPMLTNVTFSGNTADSGGGMLNADGSPTLTNVTFSGNSAGSGGGMFSGRGSPMLTNVTFSGNTATSSGGGGGMAIQRDSPTLTNVTFSANSVTYSDLGMSFGGGMINFGNPTLTNVTFSANTAVHGGGIFSANTPVHGGEISNGGLTIRNAILWGNTASFGAQISDYGNTQIFDSVVQGGCPTDSACTNLITADPRLVGLGYDGVLVYALGAGSAAINAANTADCPAADQRGFPRRGAGGFCDIGAYEAQPTSVVAADGSPQSTTIHTAFPAALQARVADAYGNLLGGSVVTFTMPASGASAAWSGSLTVTRTTGLSGIVTAPTLTANETPGVFTASAATNAGAAAFSLANLKGTTTTTITSSQNPSLPGEAIVFTVTVTSPVGTPEGTMEFYETTSPFDLMGGQQQTVTSRPLAGGMVTFTASSLAVGTHKLMALYSGDANYNASNSATFAQVVDPVPLYTLTVNMAGNGSGAVVNAPDQTSYTAGKPVTLTAKPAAGSVFSGWSGAVTTTDNPLVVTMDAAKAVTATFSTYHVYLPVTLKP